MESDKRLKLILMLNELLTALVMDAALMDGAEKEEEEEETQKGEFVQPSL